MHSKAGAMPTCRTLTCTALDLTALHLTCLGIPQRTQRIATPPPLQQRQRSVGVQDRGPRGQSDGSAVVPYRFVQLLRKQR